MDKRIVLYIIFYILWCLKAELRRVHCVIPIGSTSVLYGVSQTNEIIQLILSPNKLSLTHKENFFTWLVMAVSYCERYPIMI